MELVARALQLHQYKPSHSTATCTKILVNPDKNSRSTTLCTKMLVTHQAHAPIAYGLEEHRGVLPGNRSHPANGPLPMFAPCPQPIAFPQNQNQLGANLNTEITMTTAYSEATYGSTPVVAYNYAPVSTISTTDVPFIPGASSLAPAADDFFRHESLK